MKISLGNIIKLSSEGEKSRCAVLANILIVVPNIFKFSILTTYNRKVSSSLFQKVKSGESSQRRHLLLSDVKLNGNFSNLIQ